MDLEDSNINLKLVSVYSRFLCSSYSHVLSWKLKISDFVKHLWENLVESAIFRANLEMVTGFHYLKIFWKHFEIIFTSLKLLCQGYKLLPYVLYFRLWQQNKFTNFANHGGVSVELIRIHPLMTSGKKWSIFRPHPSPSRSVIIQTEVTHLPYEDSRHLVLSLIPPLSTVHAFSNFCF